MAKQAVTPQTNGNTPATISEEEALMQGDAGAGISNKAADNIVPQIRILQPLSPEIVEGQLPNAKAGDFLVDASGRIIPGAEGFWFQPCHFGQLWLEFKPIDSGGGYVADYPWTGTDQDNVPIPPQGARTIDKFHFKKGDNELIHYRQVSGLVWIDRIPLERTINFKSTGHTVARQWNTTAREANRFSNGKQRSIWNHVYRLTTERLTNAKGTWFQLKISAPVLIGKENAEVYDKCRDIVGDEPVQGAYMLGKALNEAFEGGRVTAEREQRAERQTEDTQAPF